MQAAPTVSTDFDFEFGTWNVHHRRLKDRLNDCTDWEEFTGTSETRPILAGNGNVEDNLIELPSGMYRAIALRSFDPDAGTWAIWWLSTAAPHDLGIPVVGRFTNGVGTFQADDELRGKPISVRFLWLLTDTSTPRWEQAFSSDGGVTWETNWTMDFERRQR